ncbi:DUF1592 domain-containing protein [Cystobacter fuscus]|uniref:DUF1592 domain-containing protein n=1 Tax=Cystobacter fuscus TaxID=43 RepID=UPI002B30841C|nr:DUF1592 domain-containing protein [Cystobacter fuscus]
MLTFRHLVALGTLASSLACGVAPPAAPGDELPSTGGPSEQFPPQPGGEAPTDTAGCPDDAEFFRTRLWEPVMSSQCITCHNAGGIAAGTRLVLTPEGEPGAEENNLDTVRAVARLWYDGTSLLLLKPSGQHPLGHGGGKLVSPDSALYADFQRFTQRAQGVPGSCEAPPPTQEACAADELDPTARRQLRMLTRFEYDNTLTDLLYLDEPSTWGQALPAEEVANGFDNAAAARTVGQLLTDKLLSASEQAALAAVEKLSRHVSCSASAACALQFIQDFGARAFRGPLTETERTRYQALYTKVSAEEGYLEGIKAVTTAMLLSPNFLYRSELGVHQGGGRYVLTDYEVASELSYLFWGSMPDAALFAKAKQGQLHTPEQIAAEARRMLTSPRSRPLLDHFMSQWMELERVDQVQKDPLVLANFSPELRKAMKTETLELFDHIVRQGSGQLSELFSADYTFASSTLATFYGLNIPVGGTTSPSGANMWSLKGTGRGGLLTHGGILAAQATPQAASPVRRGKLVRERLLCQPLPPAPPGLDLELGDTGTQQTNRERFQEHSRNAACSTCHQLMDPIGFGFEQFDSVGRYKPKMANGSLVDASGEVLASKSTQGTFVGVDGLQVKLASSPDVADCFSLQWLRFAYGVAGEENTCAASQLTKRFLQNNLSIPELIVSVTQLPRFTQRWGADISQQPPPSTDGGTGTTDGGTRPPDGGTGTTDGGTGTTDGGTRPPDGGTGTTDAGTGTTDAGTRPPDGGTGTDAGTPPPASGLQITQTIQSDWGTGYCNNVKLTNKGTTTVTWKVSITIVGTLTSAWSSYASASGSVVTFTGESWNNQLSAGASTNFGYCAKR